MALSPLSREEFMNIFGSLREASQRLQCTRQRLYLRFRGEELDQEFSDYIVGYCISHGISSKLPIRFRQRTSLEICSNETSLDAVIEAAL